MDNAKNKSNTIAEIDVNVRIEGLDARDWSQETIEELLNCVLCGSALDFKHVVDHIARNVKEEAHCPSCGVRNRAANHPLM